MGTNKYSKFTTFNCKSIKRSVDNVRLLCETSDLVALQETWLLPHDVSYLGSISDKFEYTGKSAVDTSAGILVGRPYGGVAILWRKGIFESVSVISCESCRLCAIRASTASRSIIVFSIYMPTNTSENLPIFTEILGEISAIVAGTEVESIFMLGDFNAHPHELFYNELINFCNDQDWICADVVKMGVNSDCHTFVSEAHGCRRWLDHCVVSLSAWQTIVNMGVHEDVYVSDHLPLYMTCDLGAIKQKLQLENKTRNQVIWGVRNETQINKYRNICNDKLREIDFPMEFSNCSFGLCNRVEHRHVLDKLYCRIIDSLTDAATQSCVWGSDSVVKCKRLCGWNKHVKDAHREAKLRFQNWLFYNKPSSGIVYERMRESRKIFKSRLKWCQDNQMQIKMDKITQERASKNFANFWRQTGKLGARPSLPVSVEGKSNPRDIANMFMEHFRVKSPLGISVAMTAKESACRGEVSQIYFSAKTVKETIVHMSRGKSPGHDGLSIEHFKFAGLHLSRVLAMFYTLCIRHSYLPTDMMKTIVVPIIKNRTGDISDRGNYRPISLATTAAKVLDSVLDTYLESCITLHDSQFGFKRGLSTESAILSLKYTVQYYSDRKTPVYACFLDLSKAFDLVSYDMLWRKLRDRNVPTEVIDILKYWYANQINQVKWYSTLSDAYRLECGVRQGGLTSPRLFNLYVNDLLVELSSTRVGCRVGGVSVNNISYADDMVLLGPTARSIGELLRHCEDYAARHGLIYNVTKCKYMVFKAGGKYPENIPAIKLNGLTLDKVDSFKYLGHFLTTDLKDNEDIERERRALSVRGNMLARRFSRCSEDVKITLFKAYCQSFYTGNLWVTYAKRAMDALRIQYNNIFRMLLRRPRFCSASEMFVLNRTDSFQAVIRKKTVSLLSRLRGTGNGILKIIVEDVTAPILKKMVRMVIH